MQHHDHEPEPSPEERTEVLPPTRRRRGFLVGFLGALLLLAGAYVGVAYYLSTKVPATATVGGVDVGGLSPEAAAAKVESEVAKLESEPVKVTVAEESFTLDPDRSGLRIDTAATLDGLTGFTLDPRALYDHVSGSFERDFVLKIDQDALSKAVSGAAAGIDKDPVEGTVAFTDGKLDIVEPVDGLAVDVAGTTERISAVWPHQRDIEGAGGPVGPRPGHGFAAFKSSSPTRRSPAAHGQGREDSESSAQVVTALSATSPGAVTRRSTEVLTPLVGRPGGVRCAPRPQGRQGHLQRHRGLGRAVADRRQHRGGRPGGRGARRAAHR